MWAQTQEKLALVQLAYFKKNREPGRLDEALADIGGALEEYRKAKAAFYIERAERVRARILSSRAGKFLERDILPRSGWARQDPR
jgi:hypothetical protein